LRRASAPARCRSGACAEGEKQGESPQIETLPLEQKRCQREDKIERERKNREGREIEFPKDLCANLEKCRDLSVKHNFSLI
jgi:hypothetical protein